MSAAGASVIWHDTECGGYAADLPLWEELAAASGGEVLDLGCGTGRVALHLARRGHPVVGLDSDPELLAAFERRAAGLPATAALGDARRVALDREFDLVLAPMQLVQLFDGARERRSCLRAVAAHLSRGGIAALAIVESMPPPVDSPPPLPDAREVDGWVYSSTPIDARVSGAEIRVRRLRQTVSPEGGLTEERHDVELRALDAAALEAEAEGVGLVALGRRAIPSTDDHVGSTVVLLGRGDA